MVETLGRYILNKKIASGGMADVYHAQLVGAEGFVKEVAVKKILPQWSHNHEFVEMLVDEAKVLLHLNHSNIVQVLEFNKQDETYFLVMEYIHGLDLRTLLKYQEGRYLPLPIACLIVLEVCKGLKFAHQKKDHKGHSLGIVHRDISPQNIMVSFDGEVKLTDFGIAKVKGKTSETVTGAIKGKFSYMSPEQARGSKIDARSDIFSLGLVFFEILFGEKCFDADNDLLILDLVKEAQVSIPDYLDLPEEVSLILKQCLQKDPDHRYQTIDELIDALQSYLFKDSLKVSVMDLIHLIDQTVPDSVRAENISQKTILHLPTIQTQVKENDNKTKLLLKNDNEIERDEDLSELEETTFLKEEKSQKSKSKLLIGLSITLIFILIIFTYKKNFTKSSNPLPVEIENIPETKPEVKYFKAQLKIKSKPKTLISILYDDQTLESFGENILELKLSESKKVQVRLFEEGYLSQDFTIVLDESNANVIREIYLEPKLFEVELNLQADPKEATLEIVAFDKKQKTTQRYESIGQFDQKWKIVEGMNIQAEISHPDYHSKKMKMILDQTTNQIDEFINLEPKKYGNIWINARPWGHVTVDHVVKKVETPFRSQKLLRGKYRVLVQYPPTGKQVETNVEVLENKIIKCQVNFLEDSQFKCY